ncbi:uncharacterized protein N7477_003187 [Penicillium maclennaniae]|uniref:uncharacterized protein n=1 Tax=Penicillium maclennaniae TaxID=1343394 RepID=UPI002540427A|nr:uncharacterized protein N7477_003187 [Penicillium maclennaniae]KAJ5677554.1 hypothetical protein N7477_003187 [Penicillium maclennaniae]
MSSTINESTVSASFPGSTITDISTATVTTGGITVTDTMTIATTIDNSNFTVRVTTGPLAGITPSESTIGSQTFSGSLTTVPASTITAVITWRDSTVTLAGSTTIVPASTPNKVITSPENTETVIESAILVSTATLQDPPETVPTPVSSTGTGSEVTPTENFTGTTTIAMSVCATLTINPTHTPASPLPKDYTWGCPPGYLCKPPHTGDRANCNIEAGLPAASYICRPSECLVAPPLVFEKVPDPAGNHYNVSHFYYNLDPEDFGLRYSILQSAEESIAAKRKRDMITLDGSGRSLRKYVSRQKFKEDVSNIPGVCYNDCNDAALEEQEMGKTPASCKIDSAFMVDLGNCKTCVAHYAMSPSTAWSQILLPSFAQFLDYCSDQTTTLISSTMETTAVSTTTSVVTIIESRSWTVIPVTTEASEETTGSNPVTSNASISSQLLGEATDTTSFVKSTGSAAGDSESKDSVTISTSDSDGKNIDGQNAGSMITVSTHTAKAASSIWTTRAATEGTISNPYFDWTSSRSRTRSRGRLSDTTPTESPTATADGSSGAYDTGSESHTGTTKASGSAILFTGTAPAINISHIGPLSFLLAVVAFLL